MRKEKERQFYMQHMDTFKAIAIADPFFTIKTAFFKKGKYGRQCQFFEWELKKEEDIYIEFYDNVYNENGKSTDMIPMNDDRQLFKLKYNPYYNEEYDCIEQFDSQGKPDKKFLVPLNEMSVVLQSGQEISYSLYEKRKEEAEAQVPELQKSTSLFPDFEKQFAPETDSNSTTDIKVDALVEFANSVKDAAELLINKLK